MELKLILLSDTSWPDVGTTEMQSPEMISTTRASNVFTVMELMDDTGGTYPRQIRSCCSLAVFSEAEDIAGAGWGPELVFEAVLLQAVAHCCREFVVAAEMEWD